MKKIIFFIGVLSMVGCSENVKQNTVINGVEKETIPNTIEEDKIEKIKVLNFATFHMGTTSDEHSVEFDEKDKKNQEEAKKIATLISKFKPTIICVEVPPESDEELNGEYRRFLEYPNEILDYYGEVGLVAFQVGKMCGVSKIHGIDHKLSYNYKIGDEIVNEIDDETYKAYTTNPFKYYPEINVDESKLSLLEKLKRCNHPRFLDLLIAANADILSFAGTKNGFEGADEAAKYYKRNLRIYSNLNRIKMSKEDRVFILSGGSHTAFLNEFMKRGPKYEVVNTLDYLK